MYYVCFIRNPGVAVPQRNTICYVELEMKCNREAVNLEAIGWQIGWAVGSRPKPVLSPQHTGEGHVLSLNWIIAEEPV